MYGRAIGLGIFLGTVALSCAAMGTAEKADPDIQGTITQIDQYETPGKGAVIGVVAIESTRKTGVRFDKAFVQVTRETLIVSPENRKRHPVEFANLRTGQKVKAWFIGPALQSYPVKAKARIIEITE